MRSHLYSSVLPFLLCLLFGNGILGAPFGFLPQNRRDEASAALQLLATLTNSHKGISLAPNFENQCPAIFPFVIETLPCKKQESIPAVFPEFFNRFLPLLAGKSTELLQIDICRELSRLYGRSAPEVIDLFCDNPDNLWLSKASAKSVGKMAKAFQNGKSGFALFSSGASAYGAVKLADLLGSKSLSMPQCALLATLAMLIEHSSSPEVLSLLRGEKTTETYQAIDHWFSRPFLYRTMSTGTRYALEKKLQTFYLRTELPSILIRFLMSHSNFSQRTIQILSKAYAIGSSKIVSGALAASVISGAEVAMDALSRDPEYKTALLKLQKISGDVGLTLATNAIISATLPATLLIGKPSRILMIFLLMNAACALPNLFLSQGEV